MNKSSIKSILSSVSAINNKSLKVSGIFFNSFGTSNHFLRSCILLYTVLTSIIIPTPVKPNVPAIFCTPFFLRKSEFL